MTRQPESDKQWQEVMALAERYGLIANAVGGTAILLHHDVQREQGLYERIQYKCGRGEFPSHKTADMAHNEFYLQPEAHK